MECVQQLIIPGTNSLDDCTAGWSMGTIIILVIACPQFEADVIYYYYYLNTYRRQLQKCFIQCFVILEYVHKCPSLSLLFSCLQVLKLITLCYFCPRRYCAYICNRIIIDKHLLPKNTKTYLRQQRPRKGIIALLVSKQARGLLFLLAIMGFLAQLPLYQQGFTNSK